jgi:hypothetical protein
MDEASEVRTETGDESSAVPRMLRVAAAVVAPTGLITGLLFYFGQMYVAGYCRYFAVNFTTLDISERDYLTRSVEGIFLPLVIAAALALAAFWFHRLVFRLLSAERQRAVLGVLLPVSAVVGVGLVALAAVALLAGGTVIDSFPELGGLSLATGILLVTVAVHQLPRRWGPGSASAPARRSGQGTLIAEWGAVFLLVSVGLFWAVGSYATGIGTGRAQQMEDSLTSWPDAVLHSRQSLSLHGPGVRETVCGTPDGAFPFRYEGLKLVLQSGDQYFFLPAGWTREHGSALVIPRTDDLRLEFHTAARSYPPSC